MTDCPYRYTKCSSSVAFAEANQRGLLGVHAEQTWIYMFHDIYGVAHFKHVDGSGYLLMHPDPLSTPKRSGGRK